MSIESIGEATEARDLAIAPRLRLDDRGRLIPPTEDEHRARSAALRRALAMIAEIPDDPPGSDEEFMRAIDAGRPECPLFQERY